jgi:hypothetical protein
MSTDTVELRLTAIEKDTRRMDTGIQILEATSATKADLANAMTAMTEKLANQTNRFLGWISVLTGLAITAVKYL